MTMEAYLCITQLNDFSFCPRSIYFHNIYQDNVGEQAYHGICQKKGLAAHESIDNNRYSTRKNIIQGLTVFSEKYNLLGRIDVLDIGSGELTERKYSIKRVYDGFRYQLYAQYFSLIEMGYEVERMKLYSQKDNCSHPVAIPGADETAEFESLLEDIMSFSLESPFEQNPAKCPACIYNQLCDFYGSQVHAS